MNQELQQYLSYYFVQNDKVGKVTKKDVIPVVLCSEKYAEGIYD